MRNSRSFFKPVRKFVSSCDKRSKTYLHFRFFVRKAIYSYFLFLIPFPFPTSTTHSNSYSVSYSATASVARSRSAPASAPSPNLITPRRIFIIRRRFDDVANVPAIPDSSRRARVNAASPHQRNAKWNNTKSDVIFENIAEKTRKTEKYCENARKYENAPGSIRPRKKLKIVKVAPGKSAGEYMPRKNQKGSKVARPENPAPRPRQNRRKLIRPPKSNECLPNKCFTNERLKPRKSNIRSEAQVRPRATPGGPEKITGPRCQDQPTPPTMPHAGRTPDRWTAAHAPPRSAPAPTSPERPRPGDQPGQATPQAAPHQLRPDRCHAGQATPAEGPPALDRKKPPAPAPWRSTAPAAQEGPPRAERPTGTNYHHQPQKLHHAQQSGPRCRKQAPAPYI